jgi:hypothetical protein
MFKVILTALVVLSSSYVDAAYKNYALKKINIKRYRR